MTQPETSAPLNAADTPARPATESPDWYGEAVHSVAPQPIVQSFFLLVYAVWWPFALPVWGTVAFAVAVLFVTAAVAKSVRNIQHSRRFAAIPTEEGRLIGKSMGLLSGISYGLLWAAVIALAVTGQPRWILPVVAMIIALHFVPMAWIFHRRIDYLTATIALAFGCGGLWLAAQPDVAWQVVYAVTGIGGALATGINAGYLLRGYASLRRLA